MDFIQVPMLVIAFFFVCAVADSGQIEIEEGSGQIEIEEALGSHAHCERKTKVKPMTVYFGWPTAITCESLYKWIEYEEQLNGYTATCTIRALPWADVVSNKTHTFKSNLSPELRESAQLLNVTEELPISYITQFQVSSRCLYEVIEFKKSYIPDTDCRNQPNVEPYDYEAIYEGVQKIMCDIPTTLKIVKDKLTWIWTYNCDEEMAGNVVQEDNTLAITNVSFSNVGKYMCIAQYEGKKLPIMEFDVCVKYPTVENPIAVSCRETVDIPLHSTATIECNATVAIGKVEPHLVNGAWFRGNNLNEKICDGREGRITNSTVEDEGSRIQCTMKSSAEKKCYKAVTVEPPQQKDEYTINLTIKNIKPSDFGTYRLEFGTLGGVKNFNVTLKQDKTSQQKVVVVGTSAAAGVVILLIVVILIAMRRKYDILWYWKKHFGPYEIELLTHTAYFAYYYDTEKTGETMTKTKDLVENLHNFFDKSGSTVYDDARNHNVHRFDVDNILQVHRDCHRIILVITPEFLTNEWSRFHINAALHEVVESGRKAIFVTIPEAKKALRSLADPSRKALASAMKRNITIDWNGKIPLSGSFRRRLEYALPKLPKPGYDRTLSNPSKSRLTDFSKHAASSNKYKRGFSTVVQNESEIHCL